MYTNYKWLFSFSNETDINFRSMPLCLFANAYIRVKFKLSYWELQLVVLIEPPFPSSMTHNQIMSTYMIYNSIGGT